MSAFKSYSIVPAAGRSRRMGTAKLLLDIGGRPMIDVVLEAWVASRVDRTIVVVRADDELLAARCSQFPVDVVRPDDAPSQMRTSLEIGLEFVARRYAPRPVDAWLAAPADLPGLTPAAINCLLANYDSSSPRGLTLCVDGQRGHPALLPWSSAAELRDLPPDCGLNALTRRASVKTIAWHEPGVLNDVDLPSEYRQFLNG